MAPGVAALAPQAPRRLGPLDALLGAAEALRSAGRPREAVALLAGAYASERTPQLRTALALRLAEFAAESGRRDDVACWVTRGRALVNQFADPSAEFAIALCELDLVEIRVDIASDEFVRAEGYARAVTHRLRKLASHPHRDRIAAALGACYAFLSDAQIMRGSFSDGLASALEGQSIVQTATAFASVADLDATVAVAQARIFATGSLTRAADDFAVAYSRAVSRGAGREIAKIAAGLALVSALRGDHAASAAFSLTASTIGRRMASASERTIIGIDLAAAALARRDLAGASRIVADARPLARGLHADVLDFADAEIQVRAGAPQAALELIRRASAKIERLGNDRFLGSAHRIEAEALAALGKSSAAAQRVSDALDCLGKAAHPIARVRALVLSARLTGNRRHAASARDLQAALIAV